MNPAAAVWLGFGISIAAQNCNSFYVVSSIQNQDLKISALTGYNSDIILLSDVRLNGRERVVTEKLRLSYTMYHNSSTNKRGVAVLIRNSLDCVILEQAVDPQENALLLKTIYGPNDNNCEPFFEFLRSWLTRWGGISCVIGGDWNATPSYEPVATNPDVIFMQNIPSRVRSEHVETLCADFDLSDPFRLLNPDLVPVKPDPKQ